MIPSSFTHLLMILAIFLCSSKNIQAMKLVLVYGFLWQVSDYLSLNDFSLIVKILITSTSTAICLYMASKLPPSRFALLFVILQICALISYLILHVFFTITEYANNISLVESFNLINVKLMWLDLIALAGISNELARDTRVHSDNTLYYSINSFWHSAGKKMLQKVEAEK